MRDSQPPLATAATTSPMALHETLPIARKYLSPQRMLVLLVAGIFLSEIVEMIIMYGINRVRPLSMVVEMVLDGLIMIVVAFPLIYYFAFHALLTHIEERKRGEALLSKVLDSLPVGVWITDQHGTILHGNQASQEIWAGVHYVGSEDYGKYKAWWPESGEPVKPGEWAASRALASGQTILDEEMEIECFDSTHKTILNSAVPILENGSIQGAIVVNRDITERKRAEQALARNEALFKTIFQVLPVGAWITDESGKIIFGNPAGQQIWAGAKYVGIEQYGEYKAWWLSTGKPIGADDWAVTRAVRHGVTSLNEELEIECFDGTHKLILNSAIPVRDEKGHMYGVFVLNEDITQRKQAEQALIHSNELIETAFNSIDILIAYMDRDFNFIKVNKAYAVSAGHPVEFFEGKNHFDLYPHPENLAIFQLVVTSGEPYSVMEKPFVNPEQPERSVTYWNWRLQPVRGADGTVQGVILSLVDVTERKRTELLLERQNQDLHDLSIAEGKQRQLAESLVQSMLALNASLELQDVLKSILEQIQRSISYDLANILLIDDNSLIIRYHLDLTGETEKLVNAEKPYLLDDYPFVKNIFTTHQPVLIEDTSMLQQTEIIPGMEWLHSFLSVPLIVGEHVIGVINLTSNQAGIYTQEKVRQLMAFAAPAALAVDNARLFTAELQAHQLAETLNAVSLALSQTLDFEKVLHTLADFVMRLVPVDNAYIVVVENETNLALRVTRGYKAETETKLAVGASIRLGQVPYLAQIMSEQNSLLIEDTQKYPGWETLISRATVGSWLGIPILAGGEAIGVLALQKTKPNFFNTKHIGLAELVAAQTAVAIQNAWLFEQVRAGHERLQSLSRRLVEVQESERRYIARELHDEASQSLTALKFGLRLLEQEINQPESLRPRLAEMKLITDSVMEELHRLAMGLRPASLDYLGLVPALEQLVNDSDKRYGVTVRFRATGFTAERRLPDYIETAVYRIAQEALTNAVRHAQAQNVDVILEQREEKTIIIVEDNGSGFDITGIGKSGHLGLVGMQERAQMIGARLTIESEPGCGTIIVMEVPHGN